MGSNRDSSAMHIIFNSNAGKNRSNCDNKANSPFMFINRVEQSQRRYSVMHISTSTFHIAVVLRLLGYLVDLNINVRDRMPQHKC